MSSMTPGLSLIVDASGNPCAGTFGQVLPTANIAGSSTGVSAGLCMGGLSSTTGKLTPLVIDPTGALTVRQAMTITLGCFPTTAVATGATANKSMMSFYNASTSMYLRILAFTATCLPQAAVSGGLLGTSSSYTQILFAASRITGHAGGTLATMVSHDPADDTSVDTNITARVGATVTGDTGAPLVVWDAGYNARLAVGNRTDQGSKVWTLPPGSGLHFKCITALGAANSVNFYLGAVCAQNIA